MNGCVEQLYELFLSIIGGIMAIYGVYRLVNFKPNPSKPNVTRPRLIVAIIFFTVCAIGIYSFEYNTPERKEANYINSVLKEIEEGEQIAKGLDTNDDSAKLAKKIGKIKENVSELSPPDTMTGEILTAKEAMVKGLGRVEEAVHYINTDTLADGSDLIAVALFFFKKYLNDHVDVKNMVKTEYIEMLNDKIPDTP